MIFKDFKPEDLTVLPSRRKVLENHAIYATCSPCQS